MTISDIWRRNNFSLLLAVFGKVWHSCELKYKRLLIVYQEKKLRPTLKTNHGAAKTSQLLRGKAEVEQTFWQEFPDWLSPRWNLLREEWTKRTVEGSVSTNSAEPMQRFLLGLLHPYITFIYINLYLYLHHFFFDASTPLHPWFRHLIVIFVVCTKTSLSCNLI